ncbi:hypothetical protein DPMN_032312 [Dreissena polymorpha]|uniref:Uncharacterized protein n=1 Tax=Dreissena polymorpha TaxID=45954 RepID=A0A9D4M1H9_DREPO|nr:hypothetical protein DPMN_032312 [Dreissena polymorpha]
MKREKLAAMHEQKIRHMVNKKREENKSNKVKENTDATVLKAKNDDRPNQYLSPRNRRNNGWKSKGIAKRINASRFRQIRRSALLIPRIRTTQYYMYITHWKHSHRNKKATVQYLTIEQHRQKNGAAPGPKKTYAEALSNGAHVNLQLRISSIQTSLDSLTKTVAQLVAAAARRGNDRDVLSVFQTGKHGGRQRNGFAQFRKERKQFKPFIQASH